MKGVFMLLGALGFAHAAAGQVAVTYFPVQSVLALDTDTERRLWAGLNLETNTFISNVNMELHGVVNVRKGELVNYYAGLGINANPFYALNELPLVNGYALTVGARIKPLARHRNAQLVFELSPYANRFLDGGLLRTRLGVSYNFHRSG
ncbi:hypothetical protein [Hymenobacter elongatus]|uniref:Outer membrane protein beta-barrel domain-containing protein n=1 Tax=Hymenobacter elongatus TaxID=877208 RepID=A0A4Z0PHS7_9BACT|nr:hypothetical protein [Hymenobacter elongatus]TGE13841.1 hypothetical protein E5J99_18760 [Hymenobacter elongatus]